MSVNPASQVRKDQVKFLNYLHQMRRSEGMTSVGVSDALMYLEKLLRDETQSLGMKRNDMTQHFSSG